MAQKKCGFELADCFALDCFDRRPSVLFGLGKSQAGQADSCRAVGRV